MSHTKSPQYQAKVIVLFNQAMALHQRGELARAWQIYHQVVQLDSEHFEALYMLGLIASQNQNPDLTVDLIGKAIKLKSNHVDALYNYGVALQKLNRMKEAIISFDKVIELSPYDYEAFFCRANAFQELNIFDKALNDYIHTTKIKPDFAKAYYGCALSYQKLNNFNEALKNYDRAVEIDPDYFNAYNNRGVLHHDLGRLVEALADYDKAIGINSHNPEVWRNRGEVLQELNSFKEALISYNRALELKPDYAETYFCRGLLFQKNRNFEEALSSYAFAIKFKPDFAEAYSKRGAVLQDLKRIDEALASCDHSIKIKSDYAQAHSNRGDILQDLKRLDEALASYDYAIELKPDYAEAHSNRGVVLRDLMHLEEALVSYDKAILLDPQYPEARYNKAILLLQLKQLAIGWDLYQWRWNIKKQFSKRLETSIPSWDGRTSGKQIKILFWAEQGIGDEIFYFGMLNNFAQFDAQITVSADVRLHALFKRSMPEAEFIDNKEITKVCDEIAFDYQAPIGDIGHLCSVAKLLEHQSPKPFLSINNSRSNDFKNKNHFLSDKFVCGISWKSNNKDIGSVKSLNLIDLSPLLSLENVEFVSLQYGSTADDIELVEKSIGRKIHTIGDLDIFNDLDGLTSLISLCDCVVTTSNITAHLTGAIGKKGMVLMPYSKGKNLVLAFW
jgi:tetratricopeptide (TPR) repeat protein